MSSVPCSVCGSPVDAETSETCGQCSSPICEECIDSYDGFCEGCYEEISDDEDY
ncbi:MAG: hypothetical protein ACOYEJ_02845 [Mahellales bacterium]|jgi:hypothetical protein